MAYNGRIGKLLVMVGLEIVSSPLIWSECEQDSEQLTVEILLWLCLAIVGQ